MISPLSLESLHMIISQLLLCWCCQANANINDLAKRLKQSETLNIDLQRRVDELNNELQSALGDNQRLNAELARLRVTASELQDRVDALARENKQLSGENEPVLCQSVSVSGSLDLII